MKKTNSRMLIIVQTDADSYPNKKVYHLLIEEAIYQEDSIYENIASARFLVSTYDIIVAPKIYAKYF